MTNSVDGPDRKKTGGKTHNVNEQDGMRAAIRKFARKKNMKITESVLPPKTWIKVKEKKNY